MYLFYILILPPSPPNNTYPPTYYILFIALQRAWANKYTLLLIYMEKEL